MGSSNISTCTGCNAEAHPERRQASKVELFARIVVRWKVLTIFAKYSTLDVWLASEHSSGASGRALARYALNYGIFHYSSTCKVNCTGANFCCLLEGLTVTCVLCTLSSFDDSSDAEVTDALWCDDTILSKSKSLCLDLRCNNLSIRTRASSNCSCRSCILRDWCWDCVRRLFCKIMQIILGLPHMEKSSRFPVSDQSYWGYRHLE